MALARQLSLSLTRRTAKVLRLEVPPMPVPTEADVLLRPSSPWPGSEHQTRHRWQLDLVRSLAEAAEGLRELAAELSAAHTAGWRLAEPMISGHLLATRASRRQRAGRTPGSLPPQPGPDRLACGWRLRLVDDSPLAGEDALDIADVARTPVLVWTGRSLGQVSGPDLAADVLHEIARQVAPTDLARARWGLAAARVGPNVDLVADGSALRLHAVENGVLIRTCEVLTFQHAADGARTLLQAAAAYERLAAAADTMAAAGGRLTGADEGFLHVNYHRLVQ